MKLMKSYVINLKSNSIRYQHIKNEFSTQNIKFDFFDAITPEMNHEFAKKIGMTIEKLDLTPSEISCFLSHVYLWKYAKDKNLDYIAIFEDDIYLGENASLFLNDSSWILDEFDIIKLEAFYPHVEVQKKMAINVLDNRKIYPLLSKHLGGAGYILSRKVIGKLLTDIQNNDHLEPLDHYLFEELVYDPNINIVQILPAICIQDSIKNGSHDNFSSALENERRKRFIRNTKKLSFNEKFKREVKRIFIQISQIVRKVLYRKSVVFK